MRFRSENFEIKTTPLPEPGRRLDEIMTIHFGTKKFGDERALIASSARGGKYEPQVGSGWTNGATPDLIDQQKG